MKKLSDIIQSALWKYNLTESAFALAVIWRANKHLVDLFWNMALHHIQADKFQNNTIFIKCSSNNWAQEVQLSRQVLSDLIQKDFPDKKEFGLKIINSNIKED